MAIGQAHLIGESALNGRAYAEGAGFFPLQRMPNISLSPIRSRPASTPFGGVDNGIYIIGDGSFEHRSAAP